MQCVRSFFISIVFIPLHIKKKIGHKISIIWEIGVILLSLQLGWDNGGVNGLAVPFSCCIVGVQMSVAYIGVLLLARGLGVPSAWGLWWEARVGAEEIALSRSHLVSIL